MADYGYYMLDEQILGDLGLPRLPFPVRADRAAAVFGGGGVRYEDLLDELEAFTGEHPEARGHYATTIGLLAYVVGVDMGSDGCHEGAARYLALGLAAQPQNLSLRLNYGLALQNLGLEDEALAHYEAALADPDLPTTPLLWILAARIHASRGNSARALELLEQCARFNPDDEAFWDFLGEMKQKAGSSPAAACPSCRAPMAPGLRFCTSCGASSAAPQAFCTQCGAAASPGVRFCNACGTRIA